MRCWLMVGGIANLGVLLLLLSILPDVNGCNEAVCGSIVSKCLLTQSCKCDFNKDCSCCKECSNCLSILYEECCSCVGMCPQPNDTSGALNQHSQVENLHSIPQLFQALTASDDMEERWLQFTYPIDFSQAYAPKNDMKYQMQSAEQEVVNNKPNITTFNCTVAFISKCLSWDKCKKHCLSMGASSMRWFHDGCCECIGDHCINYGINQSKCKVCSNKNEATNSLEDDYNDDDADYGEDDSI